MVPDIAKTGRSFKGAMAYYLHDKRQDEASPHLSTADRVSWTETRNLATDGPQTATRIMIATAKQADELKAAAGVKATGRKSNAHVYAYSLAWHPDEAGGLSRAEMVRAADASLAALGAADRQAVIVCHTDRGHPHVHVIVNRVHPETGIMLSTSNDRHKLDEWAVRYEKERGRIVTPERAAKHERIEKERQRHPDPAERKAYVDGAKAKAAADAEARRAVLADVKSPRASVFAVAAQGQAKPPSEGQILKDLSDAQKIRHRKEWADLSAKNKAARAAIYDKSGKHIADLVAAHKAETRPLWSQHFRDERKAWRRLDEMQRSVTGILALAFAAAKVQQRDGMAEGRGTLSLVFANVLSSDLRRETVRREIERERTALSAHIKADLDARVAQIKDARAAALTAQREAFGQARAALIEQQNAERAKVRDAWRQLYDRRGRTPIRAQNAPRPEPRKEMEREFNARASGLPNAPKAQHETRRLSVPAPAPSPAGTPPAPVTKAHEVPAKDWTVAPRQLSKAPVAAKDWGRAAEPAGKPVTPAKDWNAKAAPREVKPLQKPSKDHDHDRER